MVVLQTRRQTLTKVAGSGVQGAKQRLPMKAEKLFSDAGGNVDRLESVPRDQRQLNFGRPCHLSTGEPLPQ